MSIKGNRIQYGDNVNHTKIYRPLRERLKEKPKKGINKECLKNIYVNHYRSEVRKENGNTKEEIREKFKNYYIDFFLECGYAEKEIIPQLVEWEVESEKVIDFDKNRNRRNKFDGRTME